MSEWIPFVDLYDLSATDVMEIHATLSGLSQQYRVVSICAYGHVTSPRYAVVWAARPAKSPAQRIWKVNALQFADEYVVGHSRYYPVLVAASGNRDHDPVFLVVAETRPGTAVSGAPYPFPMALTNLTPAMAVGKTTAIGSDAPVRVPNFPVMPGTLGQVCSDARRGGLRRSFPLPNRPVFTGTRAILTTVAPYEDRQGRLRVVATFLPQPAVLGVDDFIPWGVDLAEDATSERSKRDAFVFSPAGVRLEQRVTVHDDPLLAAQAPRYIQVWHDNQLPGGWLVEVDLTEEQYRERRVLYRKLYGFYPIRLEVFEARPLATPSSKIERRFSAIFAQTDEPIARVHTKRELRPKNGAQLLFDPLEFEEWSRWMRLLMQQNGLRGAQLAVTFNGRLVFSKAYTWAEPSYPPIEVGTTINVGSVSKALTTLATIRALGLGTASESELRQALDASYWAAMGVTAPGQGDPAGQRIDGLTFQQLITQTSGIWQNYCTEADDIAIAKATDGSLPLPSDAAWEYFIGLDEINTAASQGLAPNTYNYIGTNAFLLERWLIQKTGATDGEAAMKTLLFDAVGAKSARIGGSSAWLVGEAIRHRTYTRSGTSHMRNDLAIRPAAYGLRWMPLIAPSGGWTMSATDLVRVVAALDWTLAAGRKPLLPWHAKKVALEPTPNVFDSAGTSVDITRGGLDRTVLPGGRSAVHKNGSVDGAQSYLVRYMDAALGGVVGIAFSFNGNLVGDDPDGFRGPGIGDVSGAEGLLAATPTVNWPSWDLFST